MATADALDVEIEDLGDETILRVKNTSNPTSVASALSHAIYDHRNVTLRAIGAGAVNQAVKACAIARGYVGPRGFDIAVVPGFTTVPVQGEIKELSAITLRVIIVRGG